MRHIDDSPSQKPTQANNIDNLMQEIRLLKERVAILEAEHHSAFVSPLNQVLTVPVGHEQAERSTITEIADAHNAHITVQCQQAAIAIAISTPQSCPTTPKKIRQTIQTIPKSPSTDPPPMPIPFVLSQSIGSTLSWGEMMTPREVQELLAQQPQIGEYYVVTKGRRPGVYLSWPDAHELVDGLSSPCHWKKTDKYAAQGQYTVAYNKGNCEYRFQ